MACAVVFDYEQLGASESAEELAMLGDSKKLTERRRDLLYPLVVSAAHRVVVSSASHVAIDRDGIEAANQKVLSRCLERAAIDLPSDETALLVDGLGRGLPERGIEATSIVKGDGTSAAVAAAAVVAKVARDRLMARAAERWPAYGFERHAGYPTPAHKAAVAEHGPSPWQRLSFGS